MLGDLTGVAGDGDVIGSGFFGGGLFFGGLISKELVGILFSLDSFSTGILFVSIEFGLAIGAGLDSLLNIPELLFKIGLFN
ncbi:MAG: hypothetical protein FJZ67_10145 [Bacteroidetes bacterium]|nr:hypothetical protein [Bacteroidota bacterium]